MRRSVIFIIALLTLYWGYLFLTTEPIIVHDAESFVESGRLVASEGPLGLIRMGISREPLFVWIVAASMRLGTLSGVPYQYFTKFLGFFSLGMAMVLVARLLQMLSVRRPIIVLTLLLMGISPSLVNSALSLWSESAAYVFVPLSVLMLALSFEELKARKTGQARVIVLGTATALALLGVMFVKAVMEAVVLPLLWPFAVLAFRSWRARDWKKTRQHLLFMGVVLAGFFGVVNVYKWCNWHYHQVFTFTNRGDFALYGNIARRMEPVTPARIGAAVLTVPQTGVCEPVFGKGCNVWGSVYSDTIIDNARDRLGLTALSEAAKSRYYISEALRMMAANPFQAGFFALLEGFKFFFWEGRLGFVVYPDWFEKWLESPWFFHGMTYALAIVSWLGLLTAAGIVWRGRRSLYEDDSGGPGKSVLLFSILFIVLYIGSYSFFYVLDRYAFPLASLFLMLAAVAVDRFWGSTSPQRSVVVSERPGLGRRWLAVIGIGTGLLWLLGAARLQAEHATAWKKSRMSRMWTYRPYFPYLSDVIAGKVALDPSLLNEYKDGEAYLFETYYARAVDIFPNAPSAHALLGYCLTMRGDTAGGMREFLRALQLSPTNFWYNYNVGLGYYRQGAYEKALEVLVPSLQLDVRSTLDGIVQDNLYLEIFAGIASPTKVLPEHLKEGQMEVLMLVADSYEKTGQPDVAARIRKSIDPSMLKDVLLLKPRIF